MTGTLLRYSGCDANVTVSLGRIRFISPHSGADRVSYMDITFDRGNLLMPTTDMCDMLHVGQEAVVAATAKRVGGQPDCSGIAAHLEADNA